MNKIRWIYKIFRSILLSLILVAVGLIVLLYVLLSIPPIQTKIKQTAESELTKFFGNKVEIRELDILPFNEIILHDVSFEDPYKQECLHIEKLGGGVNLFRLLLRGEIEITYIELIDFKAHVYQRTPDEPFNINYIIEAFKPKDKNKPPTLFDLKIHNIVLRGGEVKYDRMWEKENPNSDAIDFNHLLINDLRADVALPKLSNDLTEIDLRRFAFAEKSGLDVKEISGYFILGKERLVVDDFTLRLPGSQLSLANFEVPFRMFGKDAEAEDYLKIRIFDSHITPSNLSAFLPALADYEFAIPVEGVVQTNLNDVRIPAFSVKLPDGRGRLSVEGEAVNIRNSKQIEVTANAVDFNFNQDGLSLIAALVSDAKVKDIFNSLQFIDGKIAGHYRASTGDTEVEAELETAPGALTLSSKGILTKDKFDGKLALDIPRFQIDKVSNQSVVTSLGSTTLDVTGEVRFNDIKNSNARAEFSIGSIGVLNRDIENIKGQVGKSGNDYDVSLQVGDNNIDGNITASLSIEKGYKVLDVNAVINDFDTYSSLISDTRTHGIELRGVLALHAEGSNIDNLSGSVDLSDFYMSMNNRTLEVDNLLVVVDQHSETDKLIALSSEIIDVNVTGDFLLTGIPQYYRHSLSEICPAIFPAYPFTGGCGSGEFTINVKDADKIIDFFSLPVIPLTEMTLAGNFDSALGTSTIKTEIPYIQQGNKLITGTYLSLVMDSRRGDLNFDFGTVYPTKKGDLKLDLELNGGGGSYGIDIDFNRGLDTKFYGDMSLTADVKRDEFGHLECVLGFLPASLYLNGSEWKIGESEISYSSDRLEVDDFSVRHEDQFVMIDGLNNKEGDGLILLQLAEINLDYLFDTLNIPHVTFGGSATGEVVAQGLLSGSPDVRTRTLNIRDLSYNGGLIGNGDIEGILNLKDKMVSIGALIDEEGRRVADVKGGVWFGRDSLAFDFKANSVNIEFMQPFMKAFSSRVSGRATGEATLYGTFSDIDMTGKIVAEDARILIDYINVDYIASDTVYMTPGRIEIPGATIRDKNGHTAKVDGLITHEYFHKPGFRFNLSEMDNLLVYDTNKTMNPIWYGTIYADGAGAITGEPGWVKIAADVVTEKNSTFTFVLSDQQEAVKSNFLSFSDRRKEAYEASLPKEEEPEFLKQFRKTKNEETSESDVFSMDIRATVTPDVQINLIMDPIAGDKIVATGEGAMNMTYTSLTDELKLYGKYTLDKGSYNFSLQDIILKDFTIKPGSSIAFTGDPYNGILDITAAYRVNTSLTELDQSFATDKELNRTSVPVEALLKVTGALLSPSIAFDIELPTVTEETARKVKSIISTDDMMSRQVLYLVALNKFYPPEYMTTSNTGGEWASIASSTISSQIQNIIGQLTDKFTFAPSIRSDKGDFSDVEVDIALTSNLFNNRLLLNGNIGYRDPSNSSTMFVGDFDLEYLLTKSGNWRLKAYNHFNDQNYYLKSALTTQGIGIVWRKDFGYLNSSRKKKDEKDGYGKKEDEEVEEVIEVEK